MNTDAYITLVRHNFPEIEIKTAKPITSGWDSFVLEVNGELIFRFPMRDDVVEYLETELRLLPVLAPVLSTPIPRFEYFGRGDESYPYQFVGYRRLGGIALDDEGLTAEQLDGLAPALGRFLSELHRFPVERAVQAGMQDQTVEQWRERYRERYEDLQRRVFPLLDEELRAKARRVWDEFLEDEANFRFQPRLIHCDLNGEHVFCDPERGVLTGVIDWGDVTIGDPTIDFVGLHRPYGRDFIERVLEHYEGTRKDAFWQSMKFYLRYDHFSRLLYGAYSGREDFIARGIAGLRAMSLA